MPKKYRFIELLLVGGAVAFMLLTPFLYFDIHQVEHSSMFPAIRDGDYIAVRPYSDAGPKRGDIVIFYAPRYALRAGELYPKRIVGLPGERIRIYCGEIYIGTNGKEFVLAEPYLSGPTTTPFGKLDALLADNEFFVLADKRWTGEDSRDFGPVERSAIVGKVVFVFPSFLSLFKKDEQAIIPTEKISRSCRRIK